MLSLNEGWVPMAQASLWPWLSSGRDALRRSRERLMVLGGEVAWAALEPKLEPTRYARAEDRARAMHGICRRLCRTHGITARVQGALPDEPVILACNHLSYLDPVVIMALRPCSAVAKVEVSGWPVVGELLESLGIIFVDRGHPGSGAVALRKARRCLEAGVSLLNFPEGTTTRGDVVLPFHRGIFGLAEMTRHPIVPVALAFDDPEAAWVGDEAFLPHYARQSARPSTTVQVTIGDPVHPRGFVSPEAIASHVRGAMLELLAADAPH